MNFIGKSFFKFQYQHLMHISSPCQNTHHLTAIGQTKILLRILGTSNHSNIGRASTTIEHLNRIKNNLSRPIIYLKKCSLLLLSFIYGNKNDVMIFEIFLKLEASPSLLFILMMLVSFSDLHSHLQLHFIFSYLLLSIFPELLQSTTVLLQISSVQCLNLSLKLRVISIGRVKLNKHFIVSIAVFLLNCILFHADYLLLLFQTTTQLFFYLLLLNSCRILSKIVMQPESRQIVQILLGNVPPQWKVLRAIGELVFAPHSECYSRKSYKYSNFVISENVGPIFRSLEDYEKILFIMPNPQDFHCKVII
uniref:Transmembrane protein n=1 Tax=Heterorhabditis bacteriophora TaxID=37862 RepID=A0A1I7W6W5_HETBA